MPAGEALTILMEFIVLCRNSVSLNVMQSNVTHFIAYTNAATFLKFMYQQMHYLLLEESIKVFYIKVHINSAPTYFGS
jgi:hypothetical protein